MVFAESFLTSTPGIKWGNLTGRAHFEGDSKSCHVQDLKELRKKRNYFDTRLEKMDSVQEITASGKSGSGILTQGFLSDATPFAYAGLV